MLLDVMPLQRAGRPSGVLSGALQVFVRVGARSYPLFRGGFCGIVVSVINSEYTVSVRRFWYWVR